MAEDLVGKINELKSNIQSLWSKITESDDQVGKRYTVSTYANDDDINHAEDLPLTLTRDSSPGVSDDIRYYTTENSPLSVGATKVEGGGIDRFGDQGETFSADEERTDNSRLSERFYSPGLDDKDFH